MCQDSRKYRQVIDELEFTRVALDKQIKKTLSVPTKHTTLYKL